MLALLFLSACASPAPSVIDGTWQSSEPLTLEQVAQARLSEEQRQILERPGLWGHLRVTYGQGRALTEFEGRSAVLPYRLVAEAGDTVEIERVDPVTGRVGRLTMTVRDDQLWVPIRDLGFHEVFTRVDPAE